MRIEKIENFLLKTPIDEPFGWSMGWTDTRASMITKITTDDGLVGWGEGGSSPSAAVIHDVFRSLLIGKDPRNRNKLWHSMFQALHNANAAGGFGGDAISSVDIALWDLAGKAAGKGVAELLGGRVRDKIAVYATGLYYQKEEFPTKLLDEAGAYVEAGFKGMKTKVGGLSLREDVARVRVLRNAIGDDIYLMVDANKAYDVSTAIEIGRRLADLDIHWFEEPLMAHDTDGYLEVKRSQPIRVSGGEIFRNRFEFRDIITRNAVDIVQPDISLAGGITEFRNIASLANTCGIQVNPHVWGSSVMISATLNLVSTFAPNPYAHTT